MLGSVAVGVSLALDGLGAREVQGSAVIVSTLLIGRSRPACPHSVSDLREDTRQQSLEFTVGVRGLGIEPRLRCLDTLSAEAIVLAAMKEFMPDGEVPGVEVIAEGLILHELPSGVGHGCGGRSQIGDNVRIVGLADGGIGIRSNVCTAGIGHLIGELASNITGHFKAGRGRWSSWAARTRWSAWGAGMMGVTEVFGEKFEIGHTEVSGGRSLVLDAAGIVEMAGDAVRLLSRDGGQRTLRNGNRFAVLALRLRFRRSRSGRLADPRLRLCRRRVSVGA